jgi:hypothetical protein
LSFPSIEKLVQLLRDAAKRAINDYNGKRKGASMSSVFQNSLAYDADIQIIQQSDQSTVYLLKNAEDSIA